MKNHWFKKNLLSLSSMKFLQPVINFFIREKINKRKIREVSKEFSLKCRGMFGTEYAANTGFQWCFGEWTVLSHILCATPSNNTELMLCFCDMPILKSLFAPIKIFRKKNLVFIHSCRCLYEFIPHFMK